MSGLGDSREVSGATAADEPRRNRRRWVVLLLLLLLLLAGGAVWWFATQPDPDLERNIVVGSVTGDDSQPERDVAENVIAFSIDSKMEFASPSEEGDILFENPEGNGKYIRLSLVRDDDGKEIYSTGFLQPGTYVEKDALDAMVATGTYRCTALVSAYRTNDKSYIGTVAAGVTVTVGK